MALTDIDVPVLCRFPLPQQRLHTFADDGTAESDQQIGLQIVLVLLVDAFDRAVDTRDERGIIEVARGLGVYRDLWQRRELQQLLLQPFAPAALPSEHHHLLAGAQLPDHPTRMIRKNERLRHHRRYKVRQATRLSFIGEQATHLFFCREQAGRLFDSIERLFERNVHVNRSGHRQQCGIDRFVDQSSAVPTR